MPPGNYGGATPMGAGGPRGAYNPMSSPLAQAMMPTPGSMRGGVSGTSTPGATGVAPPYLSTGPGRVTGNTNQAFKSAINQNASNAATAGANAGTDRSSLTALLADPTTALTGMVNSALPQFNKELADLQGNEIRRGMSTGDMGTAYEGSLASAFQRNIAGEAAGLYGQQLQGYGNLYGTDTSASQQDENRYTQMLSGEQDYETQQQQLKAQQKNALLGGIGGLLGSALGAAGGAGGFSKLFG